MDGALGWLAGIGPLAIPGAGPPAAGPSVAMLGRIGAGGVLLSVHCDNSDWAERAKQVREQTGVTDISTGIEAKADFGSGEEPLRRTCAKQTEF